MIFLFVLKLSLKCAEIYLPVTIKASTSSDIQELWIIQNQMEKKFARAGVQILLVLLNQDFRPGGEKAWKLLECQIKNLLRASHEQIENDALASVHNRQTTSWYPLNEG